MKVATQEEWDVARKELLAAERELDEHSLRVAAQRQELPWLPVEKEYTFATADGPRTLAELFEGRSTLLIYHLMFGADWDVACPGCTMLAHQYDGAIADQLNARDVTLVSMSHAPIDKVTAYKAKQGWRVPYVSAHDSDFLYDVKYAFRREDIPTLVTEEFDLGKLLAEEPEWLQGYRDEVGASDLVSALSVRPGWDVFAMRDGVIYNTYRVYAPDRAVNHLHLRVLDLLPPE
jgi:predicted dithiol-disulfide oxidoreductase (DUF899 family)